MVRDEPTEAAALSEQCVRLVLLLLVALNVAQAVLLTIVVVM
jgi:hypothetical protein